ncbi:hypothetical protein K458DRAFT_396704 [Lentithecium fluviatile CBS 122367]|uniref:Mid2 domain-containing protein n=1 Tax=Lentithecium fluviatile CBS 122367 TaxID=1168545 RepID=A0A6G1IFJ1_9PLEO|nr:hypothetical protein K458DRAFT_396704 [Lentithecium fluviatile CBS 122367]
MPADQTPLFSNLGCNYAGFFGGGWSSLYRSLPSDAAVNSTISRQDTSLLPPATTAISRTYAKSTPTSPSDNSGSASPSPSLTDPFGTTPTSTPPSDLASSMTASPSTRMRTGISSSPSGANSEQTTTGAETADSGISRSDKIALGVGIGIGVPTVLMTALAWFYPRHRKAGLERG